MTQPPELGSMLPAPDPAEMRRAERRFDVAVKRHLSRNFGLHLVHGMLGQTGFRLINAPTFMPAYVLLLSDGSDIAVGAALALQSLGMTITPLLSATMAEHRERVLPLALTSGFFMRFAVLCIAASGFFFAPETALVVLMISMLMFGAFAGVQGVIFNFLMSKVIPVSKRGRLTGLRNFLAGITSSIVALAGGAWLLGEVPTQEGYAGIFLLAFILTMLGLSTLFFMKEPIAPERRPASSLLKRLKEVPALLRSDPAFTRYFLARAFATLGRMAMPFYILYAGESLTLTGTNLAVLTIAFTLAATVSNLAWGEMADRYGFRLVFLLSIAIWVAATGALLVADGLLLSTIVFIGIGVGTQGFQNASMNLTLEFGSRQDLPLRIAIANTGSEIAGTVGPLLGGIIAAVMGYSATFIASVVFLSLGAIMVLRWVPEPRYRQ